jgi:RNA polymerase sigma-70 factor (ECF subfamily)
MSFATRESLLMRLQDVEDAHAWDQFYQTYRPFIYQFARHRGCTHQMAQDVLQETLMTLMRVIGRFRYDPGRGRFRGFLLTVVKSRIVDAFRRESKLNLHQADSLDANDFRGMADSFHDDWESAWERDWENTLMLAALERVKERVQPHVSESFRMYVLEQQPAAKVAAALGIPEANIYNQRRRVLRMLQEEVAQIREELGEDL